MAARPDRGAPTEAIPAVIRAVSRTAVFLSAVLLAAAGGQAAAGVAAFPLTLTDATGARVTIPAQPLRIISLAPSVTEILFALGLDHQVVGVGDADDYPPDRVRSKPRVGGVVISVERVVALYPDLVIGMPSLQREQLARLRSLRLPVLAVDAASVSETIAQVRMLGRATGRVRAADGLASALQRRVQEVRPAPGRTVYVEVWHEPVLAAATGTLVDDLVGRAGGVNIFRDLRGYVPVPMEQVLTRNPQVIFLVYPGRDRLRGRPGWSALAAVQAGRVHELPASLVSRPGPRIAGGLALIARLMDNGR